MTPDAPATGDGERAYVDRPFSLVCLDEAGHERWGFVRGHRGSLDAAMDTLGRIRCTGCDNRRTSDEWDAAHA